MELRDFAERILFATTLEEKLRTPDEITDYFPGSALALPTAPGRPANLVFKPYGTGEKSDFPGLHRLEQTEERGKLLHFFANHELLATELMALVLLRFPDAPPAFRRGVLQTLQDEQEHTRLYIGQMKSCGVGLGDFPVSGYFWRCVAPMENPIDYVAGLSLTFEQANLDFAGHYGRCLAAVGDASSARLLEKIYRDEIGHVAVGLKWFRRWKNPSQTDWAAFCQALKFPLSPQRAKGFTLNMAGRRAAGFDPQFIAELNVYSQSKGRTPSVFVFNPFAEGFIAEGGAFNPTRVQLQLARDLENLPQFLCRQDDIVLLQRKPSVEFLSGIKEAGFPLPEFVELPALSPAGRGSAFRGLASRKLGRLCPWAWGTDSFKLLKPLFGSVTGEVRGDDQRFNPGLARLYSKAWSAGFLRDIISDGYCGDGARGLKTTDAQNWLCTENEVGVAVNSMPGVRDAIARIRGRGHHPVVVKEALGLAGSNALRLFEPEVLETQTRWMSKAFAQGRELVVEPWLERLQDFSVQLEMSGAGLKLCGYTGLVTDARGQFQSNFAESHHHKRLPEGIPSLFIGRPDITGRILFFYERLIARLEKELRNLNFAGPVGIDAFVYRDTAGGVRLKPVVEINPRFTMGRLLVELMRHSCPGSFGSLRLVNGAVLKQAGLGTFSDYACRLVEQFPLRLEGQPQSRLRSGAVCLNDPALAQACLAVFQVGAEPALISSKKI